MSEKIKRYNHCDYEKELRYYVIGKTHRKEVRYKNVCKDEDVEAVEQDLDLHKAIRQSQSSMIKKLRKENDELNDYICRLVYRITNGKMSKAYDIDDVMRIAEDDTNELTDKETLALKKENKELRKAVKVRDIALKMSSGSCFLKKAEEELKEQK